VSLFVSGCPETDKQTHMCMHTYLFMFYLFFRDKQTHVSGQPETAHAREACLSYLSALDVLIIGLDVLIIGQLWLSIGVFFCPFCFFWGGEPGYVHFQRQVFDPEVLPAV
jgi:hypothetical protein